LDVAHFQDIPVMRERVTPDPLEMYNFFQHTQFFSVYTVARFNPTTGSEVIQPLVSTLRRFNPGACSCDCGSVSELRLVPHIDRL